MQPLALLDEIDDFAVLHQKRRFVFGQFRVRIDEFRIQPDAADAVGQHGNGLDQLEADALLFILIAVPLIQQPEQLLPAALLNAVQPVFVAALMKYPAHQVLQLAFIVD